MTAGFVEGEVDVGRVNQGLPGPGRLVVEASLRLHTPWWGGDYDVKTVHVAEDGGGRLTPVPPYVTPLTEETVKGALRWVLRAAIASAAYKRHGVHLTLGEADEIASIVLGGASRVKAKSLLNIRVDVGEWGALARASGEVTAFISEAARMLGSLAGSLPAELRRAGIRAHVTIRMARLVLEFIDYVYKETVIASQPASEDRGRLVDFLVSIFNQIQTVRVMHRRERRRISINLVRAGILPDAVKRLHGLIMQSDCYRALAAMLSTPYVKLHLLGSADVEDLVTKLPVPPECFGSGWNVRVEIEITEEDVEGRRSVEVSRKEWDDLVRALPRIAALLLAVAPVLVGFGKGSSRGFGRWVPERIECRGEAPGEPLSCTGLEEYREPYAGVGSPEDLAARLGRYMEELVDAVGPLVDYAFSAGIVRPTAERGYPVAPGLSPRPLMLCGGGDGEEGKECSAAVELLEAVASGEPVAVLIPVEVARHPLPVHTSLLKRKAEQCAHNRGLVGAGAGWRPSSTADFINALSHATLKVTWKIACDVPIDGMGWPFHTWILGLPRQQQGRGYALDWSDRRKSPLHIIPWRGGGVLALFPTMDDHARALGSMKIRPFNVGVLDVVKGMIKGPPRDDCCSSTGYRNGEKYGLVGVALPHTVGSGCASVMLDRLNSRFDALDTFEGDVKELCGCSSVVLRGSDWDVRRAAVALMLASGVLFVVGAVGGFGGCGV